MKFFQHRPIKKIYVAAGKEKKPFLALLAQFIQVLRQYHISNTQYQLGGTENGTGSVRQAYCNFL